MLKTVAKVTGFLLLAIFMLALTTRAREERKARVRQVVRAAITPPPAAEWTEAGKAELSKDFDPPEFVVAQDREGMKACWADKFTKAIPGGPREAASLSSQRVQQIAYQSGYECAQEYSARIAASDVWVPQFKPVFVQGCVRDGGADMAAACKCLATEAPKYFGRPAEFLKAMDRNTRPAAAQRKWTKLIQACAKNAPP